MACDFITGQEPCFKFIQQKLKNRFFIEKIIPLENEMLGYLGKYFILKGANPSDFSFFLKIVPCNERQKNFVKESGVFNNEIVIYEKLFPEMKFGKRPDFILGLKDNFILLKDLSSLNFKMMDKLCPFDVKLCKSALKSIAEFHAKSFLFEQNQSILEFLKSNKVNLHTPENLMEGAVKTNIEGVCEIIDFIDNKKCELQWEKVKNVLRLQASEYYSNNMDGKKVLCHSDLWSNNILFEFDSNQNPINCCLVDFQLCRYAPPAFDVLVFLYFTSTSEMRKDNFEELVDFYYKSLKKNLKDEGVDIEKILPRDEFQDSIEKLKMKAMTGVLSYMSIDLLTTDINKKGSASKEEVWNCLSVNTKKLVLNQFKKIPEYKKRIESNLQEVYKMILGEECR